MEGGFGIICYWPQVILQLVLGNSRKPLAVHYMAVIHLSGKTFYVRNFLNKFITGVTCINHGKSKFSNFNSIPRTCERHRWCSTLTIGTVVLVGQLLQHTGAAVTVGTAPGAGIYNGYREDVSYINLGTVLPKLATIFTISSDYQMQ